MISFRGGWLYNQIISNLFSSIAAARNALGSAFQELAPIDGAMDVFVEEI